MTRHLPIEPADLTKISRKNGGAFPFWSTYKFIDGREEVEGQETRVMPVWGEEFRKEIGRDGPEVESQIKERILNLVYYLESIQKH